MNKKIKIILTCLIFFTIGLALSSIAQAQGYGFSLLRGEETGLEEAPAEVIIIRVIQWIMAIVGLVCIAFIIYGGVTYATSAGNEERVAIGKKILLWSVVGLIICILAYVIAATVVNILIAP